MKAAGRGDFRDILASVQPDAVTLNRLNCLLRSPEKVVPESCSKTVRGLMQATI